MKNTIAQGMADHFKSPVCETASLRDDSGRSIPFSILVPSNMEPISRAELQMLVAQYQLKVDSPHFVCLAPGLGEWANPFLVASHRQPPTDLDGGFFLTSQCNKTHMRQPLQLRAGSGNKGSIFFLSGEKAYSRLAGHLKYEGSVYAIDLSFRFLQIVDSFKRRDLAKHFTPSVFANEYVRIIEASGAAEPYILSGFSYGGTMALEVAKLLADRGKVVTYVVILDTCRSEYARSISQKRRLMGHISLLRQHGIAHLGKSIRNAIRKFAGGGNRANVDSSLQLYDYFSDRDLVRMFHNSPHYNGQVVLFRARSNEPFTPQEIDYGWREILPNLKIIEFDGGHQKILNDKAEFIAREFDSAISHRV